MVYCFKELKQIHAYITIPNHYQHFKSNLLTNIDLIPKCEIPLIERLRASNKFQNTTAVGRNST